MFIIIGSITVDDRKYYNSVIIFFLQMDAEFFHIINEHYGAGIEKTLQKAIIWGF